MESDRRPYRPYIPSLSTLSAGKIHRSLRRIGRDENLLTHARGTSGRREVEVPSE